MKFISRWEEKGWMRSLLVTLAIFVCTPGVRCQTAIDLRTQSKSVDFSNSNWTRPVKTVTSLPPTCNPGELVFVSTSAPGKNLYGCTATNVWTSMAPAGDLPSTTGQAGKVLSNDGSSIQWRTESVTSVMGRTGAVSKAKGDYNLTDLGDVSGKQGNSQVVTMFGGGSVNSNDCAKFDANGNIVSAGEPCGSGAGSGGAGIANYEVAFSSTSSVTISGAAHGFGHRKILVACYDNASPKRQIFPASITVDPANFDVAVGFASPVSGTCVLSGFGGMPGAGNGIQISGSTVAIDTGVVPQKSVSNTYSSGAKQTVQASATTAGLRIVPAADPSSPVAGDVNIDPAHRLRIHNGSSWSTTLADPGSDGLIRRTALGTTQAVAVCAAGQYLTGNGVDPSCAPVNASQVTNAFDKATSNDIGNQHVTIGQISEPPSPAAGRGRLFLDAADGQLKVKKASGAVVSLEGGGGSGESNTTSNEGAGVGLAMPKSGVNLPFKSLSPAAGIVITGLTNTVQLGIDTALVPQKSTPNAYAPGAKQTFQGSSTTAPFRIVDSAAPSSPERGDFHLNSTFLVPAWYTGSAWRYGMFNPGVKTGDLFTCSDTVAPCTPARIAAGVSGTFLMGNGDGNIPSFQIPNASQIANAFDKSTNNDIGPNYIDVGERVSPTIPAANSIRLFAKNGQLCSLASTGAESCGLGGGTGGSTTKLVDSNGADAVLTSAGANPVNNVTVHNAATGAAPVIRASGADTNVNLDLRAKGTGRILLTRDHTEHSVGTGIRFGNHLDTRPEINHYNSHRLEIRSVNMRIAAFSGLNPPSLTLRPNVRLAWAAVNEFHEADNDVGFRRVGPGLLELDNGKDAGSLRDLALRSVRLDPAGTTRPTCNSSQRGKLWVEYGASGVKDTVAVCAKDSSDAYDWRTIY